MAAKLDAVIYIHTWMKIGGSRCGLGRQGVRRINPPPVAPLAADVPLICGHSVGDWGLGVPAFRRHENVEIEFSGSDPHSGQVDY